MKIIYFFGFVFFTSASHSSDVKTREEFWRDEIQRSLSNYCRYLPSKICCFLKMGHKFFNTSTHQTIQRKLVQAKKIIADLEDPNFGRENALDSLNQLDLTDDYEVDLQKGCSALIRVAEIQANQQKGLLPVPEKGISTNINDYCPPLEDQNQKNNVLFTVPDENNFFPPSLDAAHQEMNVCSPSINEINPRICIVCLEKETYEFSFPCGHPLPCNDCINDKLYSSRKNQCIYCRATIMSSIKHEQLIKCTNCDINLANVYYPDCSHVVLCEKCENGYCGSCEKNQQKKIKLFFVN